ncbi:DEKNAAC100319 [Brettanomyces naardenensis]|uniref:DEKNAAC100319 n=1 Tax=Brettanomyces naardenensis TaxID=13370 RepID=A0A448YFJ7_BRENA|nr:DEKNAAC100319 [Brettanomyces naardenensis]
MLGSKSIVVDSADRPLTKVEARKSTHAKAPISRRKRRKYSRNGCLSCKKRKIKCDEKLPACSRCSRLHLDCVYYRVFKFQPALKDEEGKDIEDDSHLWPTEGQEVPTNVSSGSAAISVSENSGRNESSDLAEILPPAIRMDSSAYTPPASTSFSAEQVATLLADQELLVGDVLAADEHYQEDIVSIPSLVGSDILGLQDPDIQDFANSFLNLEVPKIVIETDRDLESAALSEYDFHINLAKSADPVAAGRIYKALRLSPVEIIHFRSFVKNVHLVLNPFDSTYLGSPFMEVFLRNAAKSSYLLNSMLASGARYLLERARSDKRCCLRDSDMPDSEYLSNLTKQIELHEKSRTVYLSNCFKFLRHSLERPEKISLEVESALLTSLILTADLSSYPDKRWNIHLKGAKQFLKDHVDEQKCITPAIILSKYLFSTLEMSAWIFSSSSSPTISSEDLKVWLPIPLNHGPMNELARLGMVYDGYRIERNEETGSQTLLPAMGEFKIYVGFTDDVLNIVKHVIIARGRANETKQPVDPLMVCKIFGLVERAKNFFIMANQAPFTIPITSKFHPLYEGVDKTKAPLGGYYHVLRKCLSPSDSWFSYFDFCNQIRTDALHLYVLVSSSFVGAPPDNKYVRQTFQNALKDVGFLIWFCDQGLQAQDGESLEKYYNSDIIITDPNDVDNIAFENNTVRISLAKRNEICSKCLKDTLDLKIDYSKYVSYQIDHRICMVQWCLLIFGYCCITAREKLVIECMVMRLLQVGIESGRFSLEKLNRVWTLRRIRFRDMTGRLFRLEQEFNDSFFMDHENGFLFT